MNKSLANRLWAPALVAVLLFSLGAAAQARAATAAGASTPRAAVITDILAIRSGDVTKLCSVANLKYLNNLPASWGKTCVAKAKRYIAAYPKQWAASRKEARETSLSLVRHAKVKIKGDQATVSWKVTTKIKKGTSTTTTTYVLTRVGHRWLVDYSISEGSSIVSASS